MMGPGSVEAPHLECGLVRCHDVGRTRTGTRHGGRRPARSPRSGGGGQAGVVAMGSSPSTTRASTRSGDLALDEAQALPELLGATAGGHGFDDPAGRDVEPVDRCVVPFGVTSSVVTITRTASSKVVVRGNACRCGPCEPSTRRSANRQRPAGTIRRRDAKAYAIDGVALTTTHAARARRLRPTRRAQGGRSLAESVTGRCRRHARRPHPGRTLRHNHTFINTDHDAACLIPGWVIGVDRLLVGHAASERLTGLPSQPPPDAPPHGTRPTTMTTAAVDRPDAGSPRHLCIRTCWGRG